MIFTAPFVLLGVLVLPALYVLLRLTPPVAKRVPFPPLALLRGLVGQERTPQHMPPWLLLLRLTAAGLVILGLAGPTWHPPESLAGNGPILLVIDNGWASAADWPARRAAALRVIASAQQANRSIAIFPTARDASNMAPQIQGVLTAPQARQVINILAPQPWPPDRVADASALQNAPETTRIYIADGITDGPGFAGFIKALHPQTIISAGALPDLLLPPSFSASGQFIIHLASPATTRVLAESRSGAVIASADLSNTDTAALDLPFSFSNQVAKLVLGTPTTAARVFLLDNAAHRALVGLNAGSNAAETPFLGAWFFARRALPAGSKIVTGDLATLIAQKMGVILLADVPLSAAQQSQAASWIAQGGVLIRFAGPLTAATPDALQPDPLLAGTTRFDSPIAGGKPQTLAPIPAHSPFAGLSVTDANISQQILADPARLDSNDVWASLADGTPLVLGKAIGRGFLVSVLTTANGDWSSLALSGSYPALLARLVRLGHGATVQPDAALPVLKQLTAFGALIPATGTASITQAALPTTLISPSHPAGLYGSQDSFVALNLGGHIPLPVAAKLPGSLPLSGQSPPMNFGADFIIAAMILLLVDLLLSLRLRGLLVILLLVPALRAQADTAPPPSAQQMAALTTTLAYVKTGDAATDKISAEGLYYLSALVAPPRTAAQLGPPAGITPGQDPINLYPLIYWPVLPEAPAPSPTACTALTGYLKHGGLLLIDTQGGAGGAPGSGAGFAPGANAALNRVIACLNLPPLEPLTPQDTLAHCFYILKDFPGRFTGAPVLIAVPAARDADNITPVIIGQNDWAGAWARDANGAPEQTPIPGGDAQRIDADMFGVNLIFYALIGSCNAYQDNLPAILDRLKTTP